ncbi:ExeM/NucH family extracellular endonuclease [Desertivibrio insolitus]|uniref:ExeM/NucH family extracellular endonuclease n=1 Tax=Herbiconiux sp. SYSU D00978 TaxID=2812562 RepID=UPI001A9678E6|nr:ExeM/NucH family extracellular endonuclease [Herbiconiux sp. SYSU D00978]
MSAIALSLLPATSAFAAPTTTIAGVQGSGTSTPVSGQSVTVQGIVTSDLMGPGNYDGYVIQSQTPDADPTTSDAVFVFIPSSGDTATLPGFGVGDLVEVTGVAGENFGLTQIRQTSVSVVQKAVGVPAPVVLPDTVVGAAREAYENVHVTLGSTYRLASTHNAVNFGELWLSAGDAPLVKNTETTDVSDPRAAAIAASNAERLLFVDDGWSRRTDTAQHTADQPWLSKDVVARNGDYVSFPGQSFILSYGFDRWRLQPTTPISSADRKGYAATFTSGNPRSAAAPAVGGDVQLGAFNVLNYFTTLTSQNTQARGAETAEEFALQEEKIVKAINALGADVVALQEIENSIKLGEERDEALATLVKALNAAGGSWDYVRTPAELVAANTDYITSAIIFDTRSVKPVGSARTIVDESVWGNAREPIAQTFDANGDVFTVVANHFKSKSGTDTIDGTDPQGEFTPDRVAQAKSLLAFTDELTAASGSEDIALIGDFNAYTQEDPIQVFTGAGWVDAESSHSGGSYTYTFDGELGSLDHILLSPSLDEQVTDAAVWSINSPEWSERAYYGVAADDTVFRSSDHDPSLVGIDFVDPVTEIDVFAINDFHGHLEAANPDPGAAVIAGALEQFRAENPATIFVSQGDNIGASTFTSFIQDDEPTLDVLNEMGLAFSVTGNHEYDRGIDDLTGRVSDSSDFPYVAANVYAADGTRIFDDYYAQTFGETTVAFVGAVTEDLPSLVSPAGLEGVSVTDISTEVNRVAEYLTDGNEANGEADVLILSLHEGAPTANPVDATGDNAFGEIVRNLDPEFDAVLSSHTHQEYSYEVAGLPIIQGGQYGQNLSHLTISVDPATGEPTGITGGIVDLSPTSHKPDPEVAQIVAAAVAEANVLGAQPLGDITADFRRAVQPAGTENRGGESTIGNFVAEVQEWATRQQGTDFALMNPGGIRSDLLYASTGSAGDADGLVTYREAATVQPFANTLVALDLTGAQLKRVLEEQWQPAGASRPFLKLGTSGSLEYTYDPTAPAGSHITGIYVDGVRVTDGDVFRVAVNSFLASGGDNFSTLAQGTNRADTGQVDLQAMVDWFEEFGTASPSSAQHAVGVVANQGGVYGPSDKVELQLSSLTFSRGEFPEGATVQVSLGGEVVATAPITRTLVSNTDEVGQASVRFPAHGAGKKGTYDLIITVPGTDTEIAYPISWDPHKKKRG